ncbi:hypothetical protein C5Y41_20035 [Rahnella variigena]|nr:hypothetical protein C5Y41_20035 [Rahnella variigena]
MYYPYPLHSSNCRCVGCTCSPESLTLVSSSGFTRLPPSCNSNYFGYVVLLLERNKRDHYHRVKAFS